tara:strand:- start:1107 stop:1778 length:672 start_codon:yes stop_codon:yes gene_type:complete
LSTKITEYINNKQTHDISNILHGIDVNIIDELVNNINVKNAFSSLTLLIPKKFFKNIDIIYIGKFDILKKRNLDALYLDGAIYLSNNQKNESDLMGNIVHEVAHNIISLTNGQVFKINNLESEFIEKRKAVYNRLKAQKKPVNLQNFLNPYFDQTFDDYLFKEIGYDLLNILSYDVVISPYSLTSIEEYFATGFDYYFLKDRKFLAKKCPELLDLITVLGEEF